MANATSTQLQELYVAYFGRAADPTGLDYWTEKGITQASFAAKMHAQAEFKDAYGSKSVEAQVNQIYKNLFDREADVAGLTYWTQQINLEVLKVAEIATHLIWAAQNNSGSSADKTALTNRTDAAVAYTAEVKSSTANILAYQPTTTDPWVAGSNIAAGVTYLSGIDGTTAYTAAGITASVATFSATAAVDGDTFTLTTTSAGASTGGAGADTWIALDNALTNYSVDGGAGSDKLTATVSGTESFTVTNVEDITFKTAANSSVDMNDFTGEETVTFSGANNISLTENAAATTYTSKMTGTSTVGIALATSSGTADSVTLNLANASTTGITTINNVETITVNGSSDNDSITLTANEATTLNITGAKELTAVLPVAADLTTVNAAAMTGDLTIELPANNVAFTGGSGADAITMSTSSLNEDDTIDGGDGADTLTLTSSIIVFASVSDTTTETLAVSNIETLALTTDSSNEAIDFDLFASPAAFTKVAVTSTLDASDITLTDIQTDHVSLRNTNNVTVADNFDAFTYDKKDSSGTADALTLDLENRDTSEAMVIGTVAAAGIETLTVNTTAGSATQGDITVTALTMTSLETLTITGDADLTLPAFSTTVETVTSTGSGDLALTFAGANVALTGGSGADTFAFGTTLDGEDVIDGGSGVDTVTVGAINTATGGTTTDLQISGIERFTMVEGEGSLGNMTWDFNGDVLSRITFTGDVNDAHTTQFEDLGSGNIDLYLAGGEAQAVDTVVIDRASDTSTDSVDVFITTDASLTFEGTITLNDEETITVDVTNTDTDGAVIIADLDASDATSVTFTNDESYVATALLTITANSIKTGATVDFSGYTNSIGNASISCDNLSADGIAGSGKIADLATLMGTAGFTAVATGSYTIKLGDNRAANLNQDQVINLGTSNTGADTIQFVNNSADATNDVGMTVIHNFNDAAGAVVTNRSLLDLSAFGIEQVSDLTITGGEAQNGSDLCQIVAADSDDFAGTITLLGVASTDLEAADFVFSA